MSRRRYAESIGRVRHLTLGEAADTMRAAAREIGGRSPEGRLALLVAAQGLDALAEMALLPEGADPEPFLLRVGADLQPAAAGRLVALELLRQLRSDGGA